MTSLLFGQAERPSVADAPRSDVALDPARFTNTPPGPPEMAPSELLAIAGQLAHRAQQWRGMRSPTRRVWDLILASEVFEAWVIGWPPGGSIELHDHGGCSGAVVVASGELVETVVEHRRGGLETRSTVLPTSASVTFGSTHVHDIVNLGTAPAISVHVYAPRLTSMTYYAFDNGRLDAGDTVRYQLGAAIP